MRPDVPISLGGVVAGKYRIDAVTGFAGMGIACEGFHLDLKTKVELQIARREHVNDERAVAHFLSEARSAAQLRSQHTRRVVDCGRLDVGAPYMVVEHLDGVDLRRVSNACGRLPAEEVMSFALQACEALGEAHSRGLVHGDLKPENLFLTHGPDGGALIKVLELGVSKPSGRFSRYMEPEQMSDPTAVDARTDIWSLGVVLHELLTGELPYEGSSVTQAVIPESLAAILLRCVDGNREARFPDAAALGRTLRAFGGGTSSVTADRVEEILRCARSSRPESETPQSVDAPESVADAPERESVVEMPESVADVPASVVDMPASVADVPASVPDVPASVPDVPASVPDVPASVPDVPASVPAPTLPRSIPVLPVLPAPPRPAPATQSESPAPPSEPITARSVPAVSHSLPAGRPSRGTGPPPLPPSHSPPPPTPSWPVARRFVVRHRVRFALAGVLLGAFVGLLVSDRASPDSEPSSASALSAGKPVVAPAQPAVAPAQPAVAPAQPAVLPLAAPDASPAPPPVAAALARTPASEPARSVPPPRDPAASATPSPAPPRPVRQRPWSPYPELKSPELPPNVR